MPERQAMSSERPTSRPPPPLLKVDDLALRFAGTGANVVDGVSFSVAAGETLCIVGESGCGKSVTALSLMGLLPMPPARLMSGTAVFDGQDLLSMPRRALGDIRGDRIAMIFQEPMTSLNPAYRIGDQIAETVLRHRGGTRAEARARALEMLERVRIPGAAQRMRDYPHQLSGGMRQRVMIAMALANDPALLIADEPTTALDVTIQAQILDLIRSLQAEMGTALVMITHDLGVVAEIADTVAVMYAGRIIEDGAVETIFDDPQHPYTIGLMSSVPSIGKREGRLTAIEGMVPSIDAMPAGCRFAPRCPFADGACTAAPPPLIPVGDRHRAACVHAPLELTFAAQARA
jgi:oligopeptide/dipeptide ABC transporter ATP-binding protein